MHLYEARYEMCFLFKIVFLDYSTAVLWKYLGKRKKNLSLENWTWHNILWYAGTDYRIEVS